MNLARLESATEILDQASVDLQELVATVADDAQFEAGGRDRGVHVLSMFPCSRKGNPQLLHSAIENVARNAVNYTAEGTEVEISMVLAADNRSAVIVIRDHGPGVPDSALKNIFEQFFRVDDARDRLSGGAGLGLSITDHIIRAQDRPHTQSTSKAARPSISALAESATPSANLRALSASALSFPAFCLYLTFTSLPHYLLFRAHPQRRPQTFARAATF